jgi:CrcB protein
MHILLIALFGAAGVLGRYLIDQRIGSGLTNNFPLSTFVINCIGSFLIGVVVVLAHQTQIFPKDIGTVLSVGLIGGFTTFSAFSLQTFQLFERGEYVIAGAYLFGSPLLGLLFVAGGIFLTRQIYA